MFEAPSGDSLFNWYNSDEPTDSRGIPVFQLDDSAADDLQIDLSFSQADSLENGDECSNCSTLLGKRRLKPRHHCRVCNRSVCAACSENRVQLGNSKELQRACRSCVSSALRSLKSTSSTIARLGYLGDQLHRMTHAFGSNDSCESLVRSRTLSSCSDIDLATRFCEEALIPLDKCMHNACQRIAELRIPSSQRQEVVAYLPKKLNGDQVLEVAGEDCWRTINAVPGTAGLAYRREKRLGAKMEELLLWGEITQGFDEDDDWVRVRLPQGSKQRSIEASTQCALSDMMDLEETQSAIAQDADDESMKSFEDEADGDREELLDVARSLTRIESAEHVTSQEAREDATKKPEEELPLQGVGNLTEASNRKQLLEVARSLAMRMEDTGTHQHQLQEDQERHRKNEGGITCTLDDAKHEELKLELEEIKLELACARARLEQANLQCERDTRRMQELQSQILQEQESGEQLLRKLKLVERSWTLRCWALFLFAVVQFVPRSFQIARWFSDVLDVGYHPKVFLAFAMPFLHGLASRVGRRMVWIMVLRRKSMLLLWWQSLMYDILSSRMKHRHGHSRSHDRHALLAPALDNRHDSRSRPPE